MSKPALGRLWSSWFPEGGRRRVTLGLTAGTAVGQAVALAAAPVLSRLYTPAEFGVYAAYLAVLGLLGPVIAWRLDYAVPLASSRGGAARVALLAAGVTCATSLLAGVVLFVAASGFDRGGVVGLVQPWLLLVVVGLAATGLAQVAGNWALRERAYQAFGRSRPTQSVVGAALQLVGGVGGGAGPLLFGDAIGRVATAAQLARGGEVRRRWRRITWAELWKVAQRYRRYPLLNVPSALLNTVGLQIPVLVLAAAFSEEVLGQFALGQRLVAAPLTLFATAIGQVFFAEGARLSQRSPHELQRIFTRLVLSLAAVGIPLGLVLFAFGAPVVEFGFGRQWALGGTFVRWLAPLVALQFIAAPLGQLFNVLDRLGLQLLWDTVRLLVVGAVLFVGVRSGDPVFAVQLYSFTMAFLYLLLLLVYAWSIQRLRRDDPLR